MFALIGLLVFLAAVTLGIYALVRSSKLLDASFVTPLLDAVPYTPVRFDAAGVYVVYHEVVHKTRFLKRFRYLLWDASNNAYIESRWAPNRRYAGGQSAQRWRVRYFDVPHAGDYQFVIDGLESGDEMKVVLGRYVLAPDAWQVAGILGLMAALLSVIVTVIGLA